MFAQLAMVLAAYKRLMHLTGAPTWLRSAITEIKQWCNIT